MPKPSSTNKKQVKTIKAWIHIKASKNNFFLYPVLQPQKPQVPYWDKGADQYVPCTITYSLPPTKAKKK